MVALRTFLALHPESQLAALAFPLIRDAASPSPDEVAENPLYASFVAMMPLGNRAEDYAVELRALESEEELGDQSAYDAFKARLDPDWLRGFHRSFYRVRAAMAEVDAAAWHRLMGPYPGVAELLRRRAGDAILAIATAKDRRSVAKLLAAYGIADLFPDGSILDKETGASKRAHIAHLAERHGLAPPEITFVEDKVNHLEDVAPLGVRCALATWGYNGEREIARATELGYRLLTLESAERELYGKA